MKRSKLLRVKVEDLLRDMKLNGFDGRDYDVMAKSCNSFSEVGRGTSGVLTMKEIFKNRSYFPVFNIRIHVRQRTFRDIGTKDNIASERDCATGVELVKTKSGMVGKALIDTSGASYLVIVPLSCNKLLPFIKRLSQCFSFPLNRGRTASGF